MENTKTAEQQDIEQLRIAFDAWLAEHGVQPLVVARGRRSGQLSPIDDFMPDSHEASFVLVPRQ